MKTKITKTILLLCAAIPFCGAAAQDYYTGRTSVDGTNVTYDVSVEGRYFDLENVENVLRNELNRFADGTPIGFRLAGLQPLVQDQIYRAVRETFSPSELAALKASDRTFMANVLVGGDGITRELDFSVPNHPTFLRLPPDKYYTLEQKLKQYLVHSFDPDSKPVALIRYTMVLRFTDIPGDGLAPEPPGGCTGGNQGGCTCG